MSDTTCAAALNIKGEHIQCDNPVPHDGWAHGNKDAEAIWCSGSRSLPGMPHYAALKDDA